MKETSDGCCQTAIIAADYIVMLELSAVNEVGRVSELRHRAALCNQPPPDEFLMHKRREIALHAAATLKQALNACERCDIWGQANPTMIQQDCPIRDEVRLIQEEVAAKRRELR